MRRARSTGSHLPAANRRQSEDASFLARGNLLGSVFTLWADTPLPGRIRATRHRWESPTLCGLRVLRDPRLEYERRTAEVLACRGHLSYLPQALSRWFCTARYPGVARHLPTTREHGD